MSWKHWWKHAYKVRHLMRHQKLRKTLLTRFPKCHNKIDDFDFEMIENNDPEVLGGDHLRGSEDPTVITSQQVHTEYAQQCWLYPIDQGGYGPGLISSYLQE
jgi:hypothetical protein